MESPSVTIQRLKAYTNESTMSYRNLKWFEELYYSGRNEADLIEYNQSAKQFIIGKCYTFFYFDPKYKDELLFWNSVPIGVFVGYHQTTKHPLFLALMFIPPQIRLKILDKIVEVNQSGIDMANKYIAKSGVSKRQLNTNYFDLKKYLKGSGFSFAIRSYIMGRISSKPLLLTYYDWWRLATFPSKFVQKKDIRAVYILYKRSINIDPFRRGGEKKLKF